MTIRRMALQSTVDDLTQNQAITVNASGLLISAGLLVYASIQNVSATDKLLGRATAGAGIIEEIACTAAGRALLDDTDVAAQRTTLGLGTNATQAANSVSITGGSIAGITDLAVADGGTGSSTAAAARLALSLVDANDRMPTAMIPTKILNSYWHGSWDEVTIVAGTWIQSNDVNKTDFDPSINAIAGYCYNTSSANSDEIHFGSIGLVPGTYKVSVGHILNTNNGIFEVLHGSVSLGTKDCYGSIVAYNVVTTFTYSPTSYYSANLRIKLSGKNASASAFRANISRIEIIRTG